MALVIFLALISPVVGLQCYQGSCFYTATEARCFSPHDYLTAVNCSHATRCKITRRTVDNTDIIDDTDIEVSIGSGSQDSDDEWNDEVVLPGYHRGCTEDETDRDCEAVTCRTEGGTRICNQTICCNTPFCNIDVKFPSSDSKGPLFTPATRTSQTPPPNAGGSGVTSNAISNCITLLSVVLSNCAAVLALAISH